jgi:hypothetical protein
MVLELRIWEQIDYFQSAAFTQDYLKGCYKIKLNKEDAEKKGYENCYSFMYYLDHGKLYYKQAEDAPLAIKPVLLFYGLVHLIKACLLTMDPNYPETTSVLAHGVTSRKRKKQHYQFVFDEVKIQRLGLFSHFSKSMFHVEHLEGEKFQMKDLFAQIPELNDCLAFFKTSNIVPVINKENQYLLPVTILDFYHTTFERFKEFIETKSQMSFHWSEMSKEHIVFTTNHTLPLPFRYHLEKDEFCLPVEKNNFMMIPELIIYYLLLYNLSMIARYETEWWSELLKTAPSNDYPLINRFLSISLNKSPYLVLQFLLENKR